MKSINFVGWYLPPTQKLRMPSNNNWWFTKKSLPPAVLSSLKDPWMLFKLALLIYFSWVCKTIKTSQNCFYIGTLHLGRPKCRFLGCAHSYLLQNKLHFLFLWGKSCFFWWCRLPLSLSSILCIFVSDTGIFYLKIEVGKKKPRGAHNWPGSNEKILIRPLSLSFWLLNYRKNRPQEIGISAGISCWGLVGACDTTLWLSCELWIGQSEDFFPRVGLLERIA